ncbi:MAG TPA: DEAD/DEAH box helicase [Candidatus Nanoarchaeia archaeon]|nr:DEAD/DEAH box helicase [Candidatus Nanoarchaeia archaeon]
MEAFKKLGLSETTLKALETLGFSEPTEIQEKTIPLALAGKDVIGGSATGSGKTLAFGASIIEKAPRGHGIQALIITPTRELAEQVGKSLRTFSRFNKLSIAMVYGGVALGPQVDEMARADVVVGTPGRILDHLERGTLTLKTVKTLVLDEADRMLDMGFIEDVNSIISQCPKERQTFLFSATITSDITHIAKKYLKNPVQVSVESYVDPSKLHQIYYDAPQDMKFSLLVHLLKHEHEGLVMVFCNTRRNTDFVAHNLQKQGIDAMAIHGGLTQAKRNRIMEHFHAGKVVVLVCTDVAARGLDIKGVSHVYNYDTPPSSKEYIHRIGRTARAGKEGKAISIVSSRDYENFRNVLEDPELRIKEEPLPPIQPLRVEFAQSQERGFGGRGEGRFGNRGGRPFSGGGGRGGGRRPFGGGGGGGRRFGGGGGGFGGRREGGQGRSFGGRREGGGGRSFGARRSFGRR